MNKNTQYGKGLFGFFFGLILATGVIGGILYFLNQDTPNAFKGATEPQKQQTEPEILKPQEKAKPESKPETEEQPVVVSVRAWLLLPDALSLREQRQAALQSQAWIQVWIFPAA